MTKWPVVPLSPGQLQDVREEDILVGGHFRKCLTYRGGGGYDQFPYICESVLGRRAAHQFIAQLRGCNLDCPYCYVTREGVWGQPVWYSTEELVSAFLGSGQEVFHLMGGAPALYLSKWPSLLEALPTRTVFHSDLMLTEKPYKASELEFIAAPNALYAVDVKGLDEEEHLANTRKPFQKNRFYDNLDLLMSSPVEFYFTYTNVKQENILWFERYVMNAYGSRGEEIVSRSFNIELIEYAALPYVDRVRWGG